ncbi:MAG TPA: glycosyltransferase [Pyrinomonadaceae bacterium]|nr:glycosyltransferase [Pyrinomonadaceae bacterium]
MKNRRIVITTFGSFGDIHPYVALARELSARGHRPVIATSPLYREKLAAAGVEFHPTRPDFPGPDRMEEAAELARRAVHPRTGGEFILKEYMLPATRDMYEDLIEVARGADLLVSHVITYAAPLVAEKLNLPWVSTVLAPINFASVYDPPVPPQLPALVHPLRLLGRAPALARPFMQFLKGRLEHWSEPVAELRAELGLRRVRHPIFEGQHSPYRVLALFSRLLAEPQPDWPPQTRVTGFCFYDRRDRPEDAPGLEPALARFLDEGDPPVVFTLGSAAVFAAGDFYRDSVAAARALNLRALLLTGDAAHNPLPAPLPEGVAAFEYAPFGELLPRARAVVHQGGVGTTAQVMRAGRPMLVVPHSHDQFDNGERARRLGVARTLPRGRYNSRRAAAELRRLLDDPSHAVNAARVGERLRAENGVGNACDLIEELLDRHPNAKH